MNHNLVITDTICQIDKDSSLVRAYDDQDRYFLLKIIQPSADSEQSRDSLRYETNILIGLESPYFPQQPRLVESENRIFLYSENFSGDLLKSLVQNSQLNLKQKLSISIEMSKAVQDVHRHKLLHRNLNSSNFLVNTELLKVQLINFELSTPLSRDGTCPKGGEMVGVLEYIAPEQTGRTNITVGYRSDFYSLGICLYELFSGITPFNDQDKLTLIHNHLAQKAPRLDKSNLDIPKAVADIVQKLLDKDSTSRYQSSFSLISDLQYCLDQHSQYETIADFEIGNNDIPEIFSLPDKLYGREDEIDFLHEQYQQICTGNSKFMLVGGYSGVGKTSLIRELSIPIIKSGGYYSSGKCEQFKKDQPYAVLVQALNQLIDQFLILEKQEQQYWIKNIKNCLGEQLHLVVDIIPKLSLLLGEVLIPKQVLIASEREHYVHSAFSHLLNALGGANHPLVLFLDDLQWVDLVSLKLLEHLITSPNCHHILIIGAYRDNEVDASHELFRCIKRFNSAGKKIPQLTLTPLTLVHVQHLVTDTLRVSIEDSATLATLCMERTQGNPFFISQLLKSLHDREVIYYHYEQGRWNWEPSLVNQQDMGNNVIELMIEKLTVLPTSTQKSLTTAANLGNQFSLEILAKVLNQDISEVAESLWPAIDHGLLVPLDDNYKYKRQPNRLILSSYAFLHDRVQQAAYRLIASDQLVQLKLTTGRTLYSFMTASKHEDLLFDVLEQLNAGAALIEQKNEALQLAQLNLQAGKKAKKSSAWTAAVIFLNKSRGIINQHNIKDKSLLHLVDCELAEATFLSGDFESTALLYDEALSMASNEMDKVAVIRIKTNQYQLQGRFLDAIEHHCFGLNLLGIAIPQTTEKIMDLAMLDLKLVEKLVSEHNSEKLMLIEELNSPQTLASMELLWGLWYASYLAGRSDLNALATTIMTRLSLEQGHSDFSAFGYVNFALILAALKGQYKDGFKWGELAISLANSRPNLIIRGSVYFLYATFTHHWNRSLDSAIPYYDQGYDWAAQSGDYATAGYITAVRATDRIICGQSLALLNTDTNDDLVLLEKFKQTDMVDCVKVGALQPIRALLGLTHHINNFNDDDFDEQKFLSQYQDAPLHLAYYFHGRIRHAYLMHDDHAQLELVSSLTQVQQYVPGQCKIPEATFYTGLIYLRQLSQLTENKQKKEFIDQVRVIIEQFNIWASNCIENYQHKYLLLKAELSNVENLFEQAANYYVNAIEEAKKANFIQCEALANECFAQYWNKRSKPVLASLFIKQAWLLYEKWGAAAKLSQLKSSWPSENFFHQSDIAPTNNQLNVDLQSLLNANKVISSEIKLESLLEKLISILLQTSSGQLAVLVNYQHRKFSVAAIGTTNDVEIFVRSPDADSAQLALKNCVPTKVLRQIEYSKETCIVNRPFDNDLFGDDDYYNTHKPLSMAALPIIYQGKLIAVVYLENNLTEDAFNPKLMTSLVSIAGQAAVSLINARLYAEQEVVVKQRTLELRQVNDELKKLSSTDGLTGVANRRAFDSQLNQEWGRAKRNHKYIGLLIIDVDYFKQYNDHYGHLGGDDCLKAVAQKIDKTFQRSQDFVARYGGEEFVVLSADSDISEMKILAQKCLDSIRSLAWPHLNSDVAEYLTISIGVTSCIAGSSFTPQQFINLADTALYMAKKQGRNQFQYKIEL